MIFTSVGLLGSRKYVDIVAGSGGAVNAFYTSAHYNNICSTKRMHFWGQFAQTKVIFVLVLSWNSHSGRFGLLGSQNCVVSVAGSRGVLL